MKIIGEYKDILTDGNGNAIVSFKVGNFLHKSYLKELDPEKTYAIEIKEVKAKRSIQQNKYMWALIHEINVAINGRAGDDMEIYTMCLERANVKFEYIACVPEAEPALREAFRAIKFIQKVHTKGRETNMYKCFIGSSKMSTKEMTDLIETVLDVASEVGIDTLYWKELLK